MTVGTWEWQKRDGDDMLKTKFYPSLTINFLRSMIKDKIPNNMDIMEMLMDFSADINQKFDDMNQRFDTLSSQMNQCFDKVDEHLNYHTTWLTEIEKNMAKKSQLQSLLIIFKDKKIINSLEVAHVQHGNSI